MTLLTINEQNELMEDYGMDIEHYWEFEEYVGYRASASDYLPDEDIPCPVMGNYNDGEQE